MIQPDQPFHIFKVDYLFLIENDKWLTVLHYREVNILFTGVKIANQSGGYLLQLRIRQTGGGTDIIFVEAISIQPGAIEGAGNAGSQQQDWQAQYKNPLSGKV